ncbi:hypothetical protein GCM10027168_31240 [Streptomyces capparidis]
MEVPNLLIVVGLAEAPGAGAAVAAGAQARAAVVATASATAVVTALRGPVLRRRRAVRMIPPPESAAGRHLVRRPGGCGGSLAAW